MSFSRKQRFSDETLMDKISDDWEFTDFTLESKDGARFPCHRTVLAAQSSVLKKMFINPMKEKKTSCLQLGYMEDIVATFANFFYDRVLEEEEESLESSQGQAKGNS